MNKKKLYKMEMLDDDTGVSSISLVENPAIGVDWVHFSEQQKKVETRLHIQDEERQIVLSAALVPDLPIDRINEKTGEEYQIFVDAATIEKIVERFMFKGNQNNVDIEHDGNLLDKEAIQIRDCFINDPVLGISNPANFPDLPPGTWFVSYRIKDPELWGMVKDGTVKAFSITGLFNYTEVEKIESEPIPEVSLSNQIDELLKIVDSCLT